MKRTDQPGRRSFLKTAALAAQSAGLSRAQQSAAGAQNPPVASKEPSPGPAPFSYPRTFTGRHLGEIAFPLGGVGAGSISLGGRGQLRDWEVFNRPDKGTSVSYAFPSIWARSGDGKPVARVLEARLQPPY